MSSYPRVRMRSRHRGTGERDVGVFGARAEDDGVAERGDGASGVDSARDMRRSRAIAAQHRTRGAMASWASASVVKKPPKWMCRARLSANITEASEIVIQS